MINRQTHCGVITNLHKAKDVITHTHTHTNSLFFLSLLSLFLLIPTSIKSAAAIESSCDHDRMCAKNPLFSDGFNVQAYAGVSPIIWANRGCMNFITMSPATPNACEKSESDDCCTAPTFLESDDCCTGTDTTAIAKVGLPQFSKLFTTPWTTGATIGYAISDNQEVFGEFNYTEAGLRREYFTANVTNAAGAAVLLQTNLDGKYRNMSAYAGYRYNFNRWCKNTSVSLAAKIGLIHHFAVRGFINSSLTSSTLDGSTTPFFSVFKRNTVFSGAGEIGFDICLNCDWSMLVNAEVAAAWGPSCQNVAIPVAELVSTNITTGKIGAEVLFPVTFGLRYKF